VIFAAKIFRYPRKQAEARRQAQDYARDMGRGGMYDGRTVD
jgi:hypothetical protein